MISRCKLGRKFKFVRKIAINSTLATAILYFAYCIAFVLIIRHWKFFEVPYLSRNLIVALLFVRILGGLSLTLLYTCYYTDNSRADIYRYFNDSKIIADLIFTHPKVWLSAVTGFNINEAENFRFLLNTQYFSHPETDPVTHNEGIIRFISILNFVSCKSIYVNTLLFNFISFIALVAVYKVIGSAWKEHSSVFLVPFFLLPSVVFWSSGLLKEQLLVCVAGLFIFFIHKSPKIYWKLVLGFLMLYFMYIIKPYIALSAAASIGFYFFAKHPKLRFAIPVVGLLALVMLSRSNYCDLLIEKRNQFVELAIMQNAGSLLPIQGVGEGCAGLLKLIPIALVNAMLQPFIWQSNSAPQIVFSLEALLGLMLSLFLLIRYFDRNSPNFILAASFLLFALLNYLIIGITVPIAGAIVHYRIFATVFLYLSVVSVIKLDKFIFDVRKPFGSIFSKLS
jgi:hypothetical protein